MEIGIVTSFMKGLSFTASLPMIQAAGFRVVGLGGIPELSGYATPEDRKVLVSLLRELGLSIDSIHAPFPEGDRLFDEDEAARQESLRLCRLALDAAAEVGGRRVVVIHLIQPYGIPAGPQRERKIDQGRRSVAELADYAGQRQVFLALENGQRQEYDDVLFQLLDEMALPQVGLCYDSGHENVQGKCFDILQRYGQRLMALHIHDNTGTDTHLLPYEGNIDWDAFRKLIPGLNYNGDLLLESSMNNSQFKEPEMFLSEAACRARKILGVSEASEH
ncbi:MAG: sugar phosphate isomerase/epimerase family protein [Lentisphaeria bacterium]